MIAWRDLSVQHPRGPWLRFADLRLDTGRTLLLRGASGTGKSSLLALLAGLLTPTSGDIEVDGVPLHRLTPRQRDAWRAAHLGVLPQRLHLSESLSVANNLALALWAGGQAGQAAQRVPQVLQRLGVADLAGRRPHELSVGQAQRVALARALLREPRLLLADEPTASLDDASATEVLALLRELSRERGATLVIATHDQRVVQALAADDPLELRL